VRHSTHVETRWSTVYCDLCGLMMDLGWELVD
jgi:hypothetical protein